MAGEEGAELRKAALILGFSALVLVLTQSRLGSQLPRKEHSRPSVYLSFERAGPREPRSGVEARSGFWLRLHNNTARPIFVYADLDQGATVERELSPTHRLLFAKDGAEVRACYDVDAAPTRISRVLPIKSSLPKAETEVPSRTDAPVSDPRTSCEWGVARNRSARIPWLAAGESVVFSVPANFLSEGLRVSTMYSYDWEADEFGYIRNDEPIHLVYFTHSQMRLEQQKSGKATNP